MPRTLPYPTWSADLAEQLRHLPITHLELVQEPRHYKITHSDDDTTVTVGYTDSPSKIVGATEAAPGLIWWGAGLAADYLLDNLTTIFTEAQMHKLFEEELTPYGLPPDRRQHWYTLARKQHDVQKKEAATTGTRVHAYIEQALRSIIDGATAPPLPENADEKITAGIEAFRSWWEQSSYHPVGVEVPVAHANLGYAGTIDVLAVNSAGEYIILDWKSSRSLHASYLRQLGAYSLAHRHLHPSDAVTQAYLVRLGKEGPDAGAFQAIHLDAWELAEAEQAFINSLALYRYTKDAERKLNDHAAYIT